MLKDPMYIVPQIWSEVEFTLEANCKQSWAGPVGLWVNEVALSWAELMGRYIVGRWYEMEFLNLGTINILSHIILCCEGELSCVWQDV